MANPMKPYPDQDEFPALIQEIMANVRKGFVWDDLDALIEAVWRDAVLYERRRALRCIDSLRFPLDVVKPGTHARTAHQMTLIIRDLIANEDKE